mgnify:CR=1 FL=1
MDIDGHDLEEIATMDGSADAFGDRPATPKSTFEAWLPALPATAWETYSAAYWAAYIKGRNNA